MPSLISKTYPLPVVMVAEERILRTSVGCKASIVSAKEETGKIRIPDGETRRLFEFRLPEIEREAAERAAELYAKAAEWKTIAAARKSAEKRGERAERRAEKAAEKLAKKDAKAAKAAVAKPAAESSSAEPADKPARKQRDRSVLIGTTPIRMVPVKQETPAPAVAETAAKAARFALAGRLASLGMY